MVLHSCGLRNAGVAQELANLLQPAVLVTVCGGWLAANCIRILDIEQDSVIHEVMLTNAIQTEKRTDYFQVSFAIPIPKHQTAACVLARRFVFWRGVSLAWPCLTSRLGVCRSFMTWDLMMLILDIMILI